jgi:type III secretion system low calcium response chaperone LcrH/SycD
MMKKEKTITDEEVEKFYSYGFAHYGTGNWDEAADVFRVLCTRRPLEPKFWFALGATLQEAGSYKQALHSWAMAALLNKKDPYPHFHAAECCFSLQRAKEAALALAESEERIARSSTHPLFDKIGILKQQWKI